MSPERFQHMLHLVGPFMQERKCRSRCPISKEERLCLTLRYLASGDSQQSISYNFRISKRTVHNIVKETCDAIWEALSGTYLKQPTTSEEWEEIAKDMLAKWNFPTCIGSLDGKHIAIECPGYSGSQYYNYKGFYSIVLMAMCDANYCFTMVDVGSYGKDNDAQIFNNSQMGQAFILNEMNLPAPSTHAGHLLPYVIVGDEIFGLKTWLMKPYSGRGLTKESAIFNYRLSRCRRTIENAFGILAARWRIFRKPIRAAPENDDSFVKACLCLHNYLILTGNAMYLPSGFVDSEDSSGNMRAGDWRNTASYHVGALQSVSIGRAFNNSSYTANQVRTAFTTYFNSDEGSLPWQNEYVLSCGRR